jgi:hypothetical protein
LTSARRLVDSVFLPAAPRSASRIFLAIFSEPVNSWPYFPVVELVSSNMEQQPIPATVSTDL